MPFAFNNANGTQSSGCGQAAPYVAPRGVDSVFSVVHSTKQRVGAHALDLVRPASTRHQAQQRRPNSEARPGQVVVAAHAESPSAASASATARASTGTRMERSLSPSPSPVTTADLLSPDHQRGSSAGISGRSEERLPRLPLPRPHISHGHSDNCPSGPSPPSSSSHNPSQGLPRAQELPASVVSEPNVTPETEEGRAVHLSKRSRPQLDPSSVIRRRSSAPSPPPDLPPPRPAAVFANLPPDEFPSQQPAIIIADPADSAWKTAACLAIYRAKCKEALEELKELPLPFSLPVGAWRALLKGEHVNLDDVFNHNVRLILKDSRMYRRGKPIAKACVRRMRDWHVAFSLYRKATLLLFPHCEEELAAHREIMAELLRVQPPNLELAFTYDNHVREMVANNPRLRLTDAHQFEDVRKIIKSEQFRQIFERHSRT